MQRKHYMSALLVAVHLLACWMLTAGFPFAVWFFMTPLILIARLFSTRRILPWIIPLAALNGTIFLDWISLYTWQAFFSVLVFWILLWTIALLITLTLLGRFGWSPLALSCAWFASSTILSLAPLGKGWTDIPAVFWPEMAPLVWWTGAPGVTFLILLANSLLCDLRHRYARYSLAGIAIITLVGAFYPAPTNRTSPALTACAVQGNFPQDWNWRVTNATNSILDAYVNISKNCARHQPDLIIWPEYAICENISTNPQIMIRLESLSEHLNADLLIGTLEWLPGTTDGMTNRTDLAVLITSSSISNYTYRSTTPAPFETCVFPGEFPGILPLKGLKAGVMVCYEELLPDNARQLAKNGASVFLAMANNAMFKNSAGIPIISMQTRLRAAENKRWLLRTANTGISQLIDPCGRLISSIPSDTPGHLYAVLHPIDELTFFSRFGPMIPLITTIFALLCIALRSQCPKNKNLRSRNGAFSQN